MDPPRQCPFRPFSDRLLPLNEHLFTPFAQNNYYRPWWNESSLKDFGSRIIEEKESYRICLDVQHYLPEEISVKVTDNDIIVEAKHEERQDKLGFISRQFRRRYLLPKDCPADNVTSSLSSDGVLSVLAPKNTFKDAEKIVQIKFCGLRQNVPNCVSEITKKSECSARVEEMKINPATKGVCRNAVKEFELVGEVKELDPKKEVEGTSKNIPKAVETKHEKTFESTIYEDPDPQNASGVTQKDIDDAIKEANELICRNQAQMSQHNRLMMSHLLGDSKGTEELYSRVDAVSRESKELMQQESSNILTEQFSKTSMSSPAAADMFSVKSTTETQSQESLLIKESENTHSVTESSEIKDVSAELKEAAENV